MSDANKNSKEYKGSIFKLTPIDEDEVRKEIRALLVRDEYIAAAFRTVRDQLVFTNKRIISADIMGVTGARKTYTIMPYARILFFSIQTPGLTELIRDSELILTFANNSVITYQIEGGRNIYGIGQVISDYIL